MVGHRYSQKGHASVSSLTRNVSDEPQRRFALLLAALGAIGVAFFLFSYDFNQEVTPLEQSRKILATLQKSPLSSAQPMVARATSVMQTGSVLPQASGLINQPLSTEALKRSLPLLGQAEVRLIRIYQLISQAKRQEALSEAESLVSDYPNFHLANLVLGDLLSLSSRPVLQLGDVPDVKVPANGNQLELLREQSRRRLLALTERPPDGSIPSQFLTLSAQSKNAIAVDASRSRLYLFENTPGSGGTTPAKMKLVGDYYISVGQLGVDKVSEGDLRTPTGVYYITSTLDPAKLPDLYGAGALPLNYPNPLDVQRGKTGRGIWLHGSPSEQFARPPRASEGCVVLSNQDLKTLLSKVKIRTTPVVIANDLQWVMPTDLEPERLRFNQTLETWRSLKSQGNLVQLKSLYSSRFDNQGQKLIDWWPRMESELRAQDKKDLHIKDLSILNWQDKDNTMVVTFSEASPGQTQGVTKRQYWIREANSWKIFNEGTV